MSFIRKLFSLVFCLALFTGVTSADLYITGDSELTIQPPNGVVHGRTVKIYTTVNNGGDQDLMGVVKFFVDGGQISVDQQVSVKSGSIPDEVFVNWQAQAGWHTISAQIYPSELEGDDTTNNFVKKSFFVDLDTDRDGVGDSGDIDDDNDGLNDDVEGAEGTGTDSRRYDTDGDGASDGADAFPLDPAEWTDTDSDGIGDNADTDDDGDGLNDDAEGSEGTGTDPLNPDTDGDGVEFCDDSDDKFPLEKLECTDRDKDGCGDNSDEDPDDASICADCDSDGVANALDEDDDNDGHPDTEDAFPCDPSEWSDKDDDELGDNADTNDRNKGPIIVLEGDQIVIVNEQVSFDASNSLDADGNIMSFLWDFGDSSETAEGTNVTHIFKEVGEYIMRLEVTDNTGESRVKESIIIVENSPLLEQTLLWLMIFLLLVFLYIFWKTVQHKKDSKKKH